MGFGGTALPRAVMFRKFAEVPGYWRTLSCAVLCASACALLSLPASSQQLAPKEPIPSQESSSRRPIRVVRTSSQTYAEMDRVESVSGARPMAESPAASPTLAPQSPGAQLIIERIEIVGNRRIPRDTLKSRIFSREGDVLSEETLHRDFLALWNTQYFEDIRTEVEDSPTRPDARVVVFYVKERPIVRRILYCKVQKNPDAGCKKFEMIPESDILERFKERKVGLSVESRFDPTRVKRAEVVLKELLGERGRQFAVVRPTYQRIAATNAIELTFNIEEGPKVKVGKIEIEGNTAFSDRKIIRSMRHSRPYAVPMLLFDWNVMSKTFDTRKLSEDLEVGVRGLYQDNGYFQVLVKEPITKTVDVKRGGLPGPWPLLGRKEGKKTDITIPIEEGDLFHMGRLVVRSIDPDKGLFFKPDYLVSVFPVKQGEVFGVDRLRKALENYKKLYGEFGFIDFTSEPDFDIDNAKKVVNLTLTFDEQKAYYVRRIEFSGNTTTRDKVIRRELLLDEGDPFNNRLWEISLLKLNQLDYFEPIKAEQNVEIKRNVKEGSVDLQVKVKEKGKQSIGLTGGISGIAGSFIGLSYQTNNLLGRGETLTFSADFGDRQRNFIFGYSNPYFMDRPIAAGFTLFSSRFSYNQAREASISLGQTINIDENLAQNYDQKRKGFTVYASYPLRRFAFTRVGLTYSLTSSDITAFSNASKLLFQSLQFRQLAGPNQLAGIVSSKIIPTISHNTVDNPMNPTRGKSFFYSMGFEGGFLGGNINTITHTFEGKYFKPVNKGRNVLGFRALAAIATGYGDVVLPPFNRFYIGGEDSIRGFDYFTVSPWSFVPTDQTVAISYSDPTSIGPGGLPVFRSLAVPILDYQATQPGGDTQFVSNNEYRIPIVGPVTLGVFFDLGLNGAIRKGQLQLSQSGADRLRQIFPNSTISNQIQILNSSNFRVRASTGVEFVVQLPIINAPFRLYWAYNPLRYRETVVEPRGDFYLNPAVINSLPPGVYESQILPQINTLLDRLQVRGRPFEPEKTFRFTVSRTF